MADQVSSSSHPHKRARVVGDAVQVASKAAAPSAPRIFAPFRALGFISNHVPFALQSRRGGRDATRPSVNVITCLGDSWAMWDADRITLLFVGEFLDAQEL